MKLPKIEVPVYKTKMIMGNKEITYRPFLVKEEKILLTAMQTDDTENIIENLINVIQNCMITEINVSEIPYFEFINLFIKIRGKSLGEMLDINVTDSKVNKKFDTQIDLNDVKAINTKKIDNKININDNIGVILDYPNIKTHLKFYFKNKKEKLNGDDLTGIVCACIKQIYDKENTYDPKEFSEQELNEFIESIPLSDMSKISNYFENMPKIIYEKEHLSPFTNKNIKVNIENIIDFLI